MATRRSRPVGPEPAVAGAAAGVPSRGPEGAGPPAAESALAAEQVRAAFWRRAARWALVVNRPAASPVRAALRAPAESWPRAVRARAAPLIRARRTPEIRRSIPRRRMRRAPTD